MSLVEVPSDTDMGTYIHTYTYTYALTVPEY